MKKITFKGFLTFLFMFCIITTNAQEKSALVPSKAVDIKKSTPTQSGQKQNASVVQDDILSNLTIANQNSLAETGYVRCASVEMDNRRMNNAGNKQQYDEAFENWLAPLVEAKRQEIAQQKANGTFKKAVVTIPIVFHVITSGSGPTNLSQAIINAQIDQLNLDFSNQGGVNGAPSGNAVAADAEIVFVPAAVDPSGNTLAEPGIDRVTTFGAGPFPTTDFDGGDGGLEIKPATIWDRSLYANVWTADISGGILGYAQFPSNSTLPGFPADGGSQLNDGVVCGYGTIGSRDLPGSAPPYNLGRTLTHEVGHWIGLRHIWGDTSTCGAYDETAGDYVADTPPATGSNFGCPTGTNSCNGDAFPDMVENYMDYTDDSCMDIFTAGQVLRIVTVLENADGISNLPNSTTGNADPTISFASATATFNEGSDCSFTDYVIPVNLAQAASQAATANFFLNGTTGTDGVDFAIQTSSITFAQGATAPQDFTLRVYNDSFVEGDETVTINFTVNANGGDAIAGVDSIVVTLADDDVVPVNTQTTTLLSSDFEAADTTAWYVIDNDGDNNVFLGLNGGGGPFMTGIDGVFIGSESNGGALNNGGNFSPDNFLISDPIVIPADATNVNFNFGIGGFQDSEPYEVYWTTDDTSAATITAGTQIDSGNTVNGDGAYRNIDVTTIAGQTGFLAFRHLSQGNGPNRTDGILLIDNVTITATVSKAIQTAVNTTTTEDQISLPSTGSVYTADSASGDLMLDIINNSADDYGCTTVSVSRAGTGAQAYNGSASPDFVTDKTFTITTANTVANGNVDVAFYFNDSNGAELAGWEALGNNRADLYAYREGSNDVVPLTVSAFGTDIKLTGTFTGLDGTYYFGPQSAFNRVLVAPKVMLQGAALNPNVGEETLMRDDLRVAGIIPTTSPYDATTCDASVFNATGANAIVDWVWVELRDATTNTTVVASQSALLQRDGDVVSVDGTSALAFSIPSDNYYVVVNHTNHLAIMSASAILLDGTERVVNFADGSTATSGTNAQTTFGMQAGVSAMWAGDVNGDGTVQYSGTTPDSPSILSTVLNDAGNFLNFPTYVVAGYNVYDVNMDGNTQYSGTTPDTPFILQNVLAHPGNFLNFSTFAIQQQLP